MKKLLTITLLLALTSSLTANSLDISKVKYSVNGGVNVTTLSEHKGTTYDSMVGFRVGGKATLPINKDLSISSDLNFSQAGAKTSTSESNIIGDFEASREIRRNYITVPVNLNYNVTEQATISFGPYVSYLIDAESKTSTKINDKITKKTTTSEETTNLKEKTRKLDYGVQVGASTQIEQFTISAQYSLGLNQTVSDTDAKQIGEAKNSGFTFSAGYNF